MSAVVQQLRNEMTAGMALSNVAIDVRSEPLKGSGFVGDPHNPPKYHEVAHLNILGIAPMTVRSRSSSKRFRATRSSRE